MQTIVRKKGSFDDLAFEVDLTEYGKTLSDVDDIFFSVKVNKTDADDSLFLKKKSLGEIEATGTDLLSVTVEWSEDEYTAFVTGLEYIAGLFIKWTGDPVADENVDTTFKIIIEQDFLEL